MALDARLKTNGNGLPIGERTPRQAAEQATFQNFANCYLREIDSGAEVRHGPEGCGAIECALPVQQAWLRIELVAASRCGPHRLGRAWMRRQLETTWRQAEPFTALQALLQEAYRRIAAERADKAETLRGFELELLYRVLDSYQSTTLYLETPAPDARLSDFLAAEQSLAYGHWQHPTPKSRQGMTSWQQSAYAPELGGRFQLVYFAADKALVTHASAAGRSASEIVAALLGDEAETLGREPHEALIPMHPLQAEALLLDPDIKSLIADGRLRPLGPAGGEFSATSSVRTVYSPDAEWMLKFSLPVQITNSVRVNRRHELEAGVAMTRLFERSGFLKRHPRLRVLNDPAYVTLDLAHRNESGFEVIFRENPFTAGADHGVVTVAALTAEGRPGQASRIAQLIGEIVARDGLSTTEACQRWFSAHLDCALDPLIQLYDELGVALEAHQQNSLLDIRAGYPSAYYYRDSQGFYLSNRYRAALRRLAPETERVAHLHYDEAKIHDPLAYYLIVNQLFSIVNRMANDGLCEEAPLLAHLSERLDRLAERLPGAGGDFARGVLSSPTIAAKANLLTRLFDIDELESGDESAAYRRLPNPLFNAVSHGAGHAVAV